MSTNTAVKTVLDYFATSSTIDNNFIADRFGASNDQLGIWALHGELPLSYGKEKGEDEIASPRAKEYLNTLSGYIYKNYSQEAPLKDIIKQSLLDISSDPKFKSSKHGASVAFCRYSTDGSQMDWFVIGDCYITVKYGLGWITHRDPRFNNSARSARKEFINSSFAEGKQYRKLKEFSQNRRAYLAAHRKHRGANTEPYYYTVSPEIIAGSEDPERTAEYVVSARGLSGTYVIDPQKVSDETNAVKYGSVLLNRNMLSHCVIDGRVLLWTGSVYNTIEQVIDDDVRSDSINKLMDGSIREELVNISKGMRYKFGFSDAMALLRAEPEKK